MTIIGLVNGMIGGTCLVLPHIGLRTGWLTSILVALVTGWISYYTAYLIILHLGKGSQIKDCILNHFNNDYKYMTGYSFIIWVSFMPYMLIYFRIICLQIEGLIGHHSDLIGPLVAVGLVILVIFVRIYHVGEETLAYGIISIVGYLVFLIWAHFSAPEGPKTVKATG
jgi:amino acid permease